VAAIAQQLRLYEYANYLRATARLLGRTNDCVPNAIANALGYGYTEAERVCIQHGYRINTGLPISDNNQELEAILTSLGYKVVQWTPVPAEGRVTVRVRELPKLLDHGRWLAITTGHVLAVVDGLVLDWTEERNHIVISLIEVI